MKIAIYGDSMVDPHHLEVCKRYNPVFDYEESFNNTWYNLLRNDNHDVDIYGAMSRDNWWIDRQHRENFHKYDLNIIRPGEPLRLPLLRHPDEDWHRLHRELFFDAGPSDMALLHPDCDREHPYIVALSVYLENMYDKGTIIRQYNLLLDAWRNTENTVVIPSDLVNISSKNYDAYSGFVKVHNAISRERRHWVNYMMNKYPDIKIINDTENTIRPFHKHANHTPLANHKIFYEIVDTYIKTGKLQAREPSPIDMFTFPHPVMDLVEQNVLENNGLL